jgi:hypothetical protein
MYHFLEHTNILSSQEFGSQNNLQKGNRASFHAFGRTTTFLPSHQVADAAMHFHGLFKPPVWLVAAGRHEAFVSLDH